MFYQTNLISNTTRCPFTNLLRVIECNKSVLVRPSTSLTGRLSLQQPNGRPCPGCMSCGIPPHICTSMVDMSSRDLSFHRPIFVSDYSPRSTVYRKTQIYTCVDKILREFLQTFIRIQCIAGKVISHLPFTDGHFERTGFFPRVC